MTRAECILAHITRELDRKERALENDPDLSQVVLCVKFKHGKVRAVQINISSERETEMKAA